MAYEREAVKARDKKEYCLVSAHMEGLHTTTRQEYRELARLHAGNDFGWFDLENNYMLVKIISNTNSADPTAQRTKRMYPGDTSRGIHATPTSPTRRTQGQEQHQCGNTLHNGSKHNTRKSIDLLATTNIVLILSVVIDGGLTRSVNESSQK